MFCDVTRSWPLADFPVRPQQHCRVKVSYTRCCQCFSLAQINSLQLLNRLWLTCCSCAVNIWDTSSWMFFLVISPCVNWFDSLYLLSTSTGRIYVVYHENDFAIKPSSWPLTLNSLFKVCMEFSVLCAFAEFYLKCLFIFLCHLPERWFQHLTCIPHRCYYFCQMQRDQ